MTTDRSPLRSAAFVAAFVATACLVPAGVFRALDRFGVERVDVGLDVITSIRETLPTLRDEAVAGGTWQVGYLGDSMVVSYPPGRTVPERLQQVAAAHGEGSVPIRVHTLAAPGMGPFDYYFIADEVARAGPDQVILPFNLSALSDDWRGTFSRPELAGFIEPSRIPEALSLPIDWIGLTADRLLSYVAIVRLGADEPWHDLLREQARLDRARNLSAAALGELFGSTAFVDFGAARFEKSADAIYFVDEDHSQHRNRFNAAGQRARFGVALDGATRDHPVIRLLEAAVRRFSGAGIRVLVYVNPTNIQHIERTGTLDKKGLSQTLWAIAGAVQWAGGRFADLHRLLPDEAFRDGAGHFQVIGKGPDGPLLLAEALAPYVVEEARRTGGEAD